MAWSYVHALWKPMLLCVVALVFLRRPPPGLRGGMALAAQLMLGTAVELTGSIAALRGQYNLHLYDFYGVPEFLLLAAFGWAQFPHVRMRRTGRAAAWAVAAGLAWWEWPLMVSDSLSANRALLVHSILLTGLFLAVLFRLALTSLRPLHRLPLFWIALGLVLFYGLELPFRGLYNELVTRDLALARQLYLINYLTFALRYGLVLVACAVGAGQHPSPEPWTTSASPSS